MTKHDWIWIAIRIFGIYLLVEAVLAIPNLISSAIFFCQAFNFPHSGSADLDKLQQTLHFNSANLFVSSLAKLIVCSAVGIYLVKGGSWLFKILCPPDSE
jgi:hypothetical protein